MLHHFGVRMVRISCMSVCILSGFQSSPRNQVLFLQVDRKKNTRLKGHNKQKMTRVTNLSSRKTHSLGREFGCVLAFDGLRVVIFEEDTGCGL